MLNAELLTSLAKLQINILNMHYSKATYTDSLSYVQIHIHCNSFCELPDCKEIQHKNNSTNMCQQISQQAKNKPCMNRCKGRKQNPIPKNPL